MSWRDSASSFVKTFGSAAKFVAKQALNNFVPGYPLLADAVEMMLDTASEAHQQRAVGARLDAQEARFDEAALLLDVMQRQLGDLFKEVAKWQEFPDQASAILQEHLRNDPFLLQVKQTLEKMAERLARHEKRLDDLEADIKRLREQGLSNSLIRSLVLKRELRKQRADGPKPGTKLGDWTLRRRIGEGGMGQVFEAERDGEVGALKLIDRRQLDEPGMERRFKDELRTLAILSHRPHPNLVTILDQDRDPTHGLYLVMAYIEGVTLEHHLARNGALPEADARKMFAALADGVAFIHTHDILHGDIKPANVVVRPDGTPVLVDFGLAKAVRGEAGTQAFGLSKIFCAKEQQDLGTACRESDVCSLAKTMFYALLHGDVKRRVLFKVEHAPATLREALAVCLDADPEARMSAAELRDRLRGVTPTPVKYPEAIPVPQQPKAPPPPPERKAGDPFSLMIPEPPLPTPPGGHPRLLTLPIPAYLSPAPPNNLPRLLTLRWRAAR